MIFDRSELNSIVSKVGDTLVDTGKNIKETAKVAIDTAPISLKLREKENYLEKQYFELGVLYFQNHVDDEEPEFDQIRRIEETQEEIRQLRDEIADKKGKDVCPYCGEYIEKEKKFCANCGKKL